MEAQGQRYVVQTSDTTKAQKLLAMNQLIDGTPVEVVRHPYLNVKKVIISCPLFIDESEQAILEDLAEQGIIEVRRIKKRVNGDQINTPALVLSFSGNTAPKHVYLGMIRIPTRTYYPNPMQCYNCFAYGHTKARCPQKTATCITCSTIHEEGNCSGTPYCKNCKGNHQPTYRGCEKYKFEQEVIKIKTDCNISFPEARSRVEKEMPSYAKAASAQPRLDNAREQAFINKINSQQAEIESLKQQIAELKALIQVSPQPTTQTDMEISVMLTQPDNSSTPSINSRARTPKRGQNRSPEAAPLKKKGNDILHTDHEGKFPTTQAISAPASKNGPRTRSKSRHMET